MSPGIALPPMKPFDSAPVTNFPAGNAQVTMFVNGIPSGSSTLLLGLPPLCWNSVRMLPDGSCQSALTKLPEFGFGVVATNLLTPLANWLWRGVAAEPFTGHYEFVDLRATNFSQRFYSIRWP